MRDMGRHVSVKRGKLENLNLMHWYSKIIIKAMTSLCTAHIHALLQGTSLDDDIITCLENPISMNLIYWWSRINSCGWVRFIAPEGSQLDIFRSSLLSFKHFRFLKHLSLVRFVPYGCVLLNRQIYSYFDFLISTFGLYKVITANTSNGWIG